MRLLRFFSSTAPIAALVLAATPVILAACSGGASHATTTTTKGVPKPGQTTFVSATPPGQTYHNGSGSKSASSGGIEAPSAAADAGAASGASTTTSSSGRTVQETDLYRVEGNTLYYLNAYRGLMVFDVSSIDHPKFLGRFGVYGSPVDMIVNGSVATVIVGDWYGNLPNGTPFYGSVVENLDASDPANIQMTGQVMLEGDIQDSRVVGNVLYTVSEDWGWEYGWYGAGNDVATDPNGGTSTQADVIVASVNFAGGNLSTVSTKRYSGYGGVFNVTPNAIMLAHQPPDEGDAGLVPVGSSSGNGSGDDAGVGDAAVTGDAEATDGSTYIVDGGIIDGGYGLDASVVYYGPSSQTVLEYLDITDPNGAIVERGNITVNGNLQAWGADNGRWTLDFADGKTAHVIGCAGSDWDCGSSSYVLSTVDFSNPDVPAFDSQLNIPATGWSITARFDSGRMYLSPSDDYYYYGSSTSTPLEVFDLSDPMAPKLVGQTKVPGEAWLIIPSGQQLFDLGQTMSDTSNAVSLSYLDVANPASPKLIGTSTFGGDWAWTPAADTFKAFTMDATRGLVVLPFSGWDASSGLYNNGVQLIEFTPTSIQTAGAAHIHGWVERGIFVGNRIVSLSDLALAIVDYSDPMNPKVTSEMTLARNVIAAQANGSTITEVSSDWWGNDSTSSEVRVLPISDPGEYLDESKAPDATVDGVNATVFTNGNLSYIVTTVGVNGPCPTYYGSTSSMCQLPQEQVQVVDTSNGKAKLRGKVLLPIDPNSYFYWGGLDWYGGWYWYDWYDGAEVVQVGHDALAFRRWDPLYDASGNYVDSASDLYIVDMSNPDNPAIASTIITEDQTAWWGDMQVIGNTLYTMDYEWVDTSGNQQTVSNYLDVINLSDRSHPVVGARINVPGMLIGGSSTDPSILYTADYIWSSDTSFNTIDVVQINGTTATLLSVLTLDGYPGSVFQQGNTLYTSVEVYSQNDYSGTVELHQIDMSNPSQPTDYVSSGSSGWGWLLGVVGDRALVTSGWGGQGIDVYKLHSHAAPVYDQFLLASGWGVYSASRQGNSLFLSSGYWGVQSYQLQ